MHEKWTGMKNIDLPLTLDVEIIRVCRDHASKAQMEVQRVLKKISGLEVSWMGKVGGTTWQISPQNLSGLLIQLRWFLDQQYETRKPGSVKPIRLPPAKAKAYRSKKIDHVHRRRQEEEENERQQEIHEHGDEWYGNPWYRSESNQPYYGQPIKKPEIKPKKILLPSSTKEILENDDCKT